MNKNIKSNFIRNKKKHLLFFFTFIVFILSFTFNTWGIVNKWLFYEFDPRSEALVFGRLDKSEQDGILSAGGFPCRYYTLKEGQKREDLNILKDIVYPQKENFINDIPNKGEVDIYKSQSGGQIFIYSLIQTTLPLKNKIKLQIYRFLNTFIFAFFLSLFILWVYKNYNMTSSIICFILLLFSPILTSMAHNIWWVLWSYFIPFLTVLLLLDKRETNPKKITYRKIYLYLFLGMFFKCFLTGFEFISATAIAAIIPFIYYGIKNKSAFSCIIKRIFYAGISCLAAIISSMGILIIQFKILFGSFTQGIEHIFFSFTKWNNPEIEKTGIGGERLWEDVLSPALKINIIHHDSLSFAINLLSMIIIIVCCCFILYFINRKLKINDKQNQKNNALIITTLISFAAPLSWYILFKGHVFVHPFLDYIVFYIPTFLLGFLLIGQTIFSITKALKPIIKSS